MPGTKPVLMILTSHRRDCFSLCLQCLEWFTDLDAFARIYVLANEADPEHRQVILDFKARRPRGQVAELHCAPRARGYNPCLSAMWNEVLSRHKNDVVVKLDEDVFVTPGWLPRLLSSFARRADDDTLLVTPLIPNNDQGRFFMDAYLRARWAGEFAGEVAETPIFANGAYGAWVWDKVLREDLLDGFRDFGRPEGLPVPGLSINCIVFGPLLTNLIFPLAANDEFTINHLLQRGGMRGWLEAGAVAHHYSFYRQQDAVDAAVSLDAVRLHLARQLPGRAVRAA
ncbi:MAG: hypothetical protein AB1916_14530 [Thermodesulfobacteriota bacterium]